MSELKQQAIPYVVALRKENDTALHHAYRKVKPYLGWLPNAWVPKPKRPPLSNGEAACVFFRLGAYRIPEITSCLQDRHEGVRISAAKALNQFSSSLREHSLLRASIPALIQAMQDSNGEVRQSAVGTLANLAANLD